MQQFEPCPSKCFAKRSWIFHKAFANCTITGVHFEGHIGGGHHWQNFLAATIDLGCHVFGGTIDGVPDVGTGGAFGQLPFVFEQQVEVAHVPLSGVGRPRTFDAAGDCIDAFAALVGAGPAKALGFDGGTFGLGTDARRRTIAVGLTKGVTTGHEGECFFVVHCHTLERLTDVLGRQQRIGGAVGPFRIDINQAHLHGSQGVFQILA